MVIFGDAVGLGVSARRANMNYSCKFAVFGFDFVRFHQFLAFAGAVGLCLRAATKGTPGNDSEMFWALVARFFGNFGRQILRCAG